VVDESGSLSPEDVANERAAAALLIQGDPSRRSRAMVIGFGSADAAGQTPVDEVCPLTTLDVAGRQQLASCVGALHRRTQAEGAGTDFPAAIRQAVQRLTAGSAASTPKIIFLLTDGKLDVSDSPAYGEPGSRAANGERILEEELRTARDRNVQIWPLGFGTKLDRGQLTNLAAKGYQLACANLPSAKPHMNIVAKSADATLAFQQAFAWARCLGWNAGTKGRPPVDLTVAIPPVATEGTITVIKQDPAVAVTYHDPQGRQVPTSGSFDGSQFERSGQDSPVEALRIKDPRPGTWRVRLVASGGGDQADASVSVIWKGVLRSSITMTPSAPTPGEQTVVEMRLQTRRGVVLSKPEELAGIAVSVSLTGDGFREPVEAVLRDDGAAPDATAHDGHFSGQLTVPASATGSLGLTGEMLAQGVTGDRRLFPTRIADSATAVTAKASLDQHTVHPGGKVRGVLDARNNDTVPHDVGLVLADADALPVTVDPRSVTVPPGQSVQVPFAVSYGRAAPIGASGGRISVVDRVGDRELSSTFLTVDVQPIPTWWDRWWWAAILGGALAVATLSALIAWLRFRRSQMGAQDLTLKLLRDNEVLSELTIGHTQGPWCKFSVVKDTPADLPRLERDSGGRYAVRRTLDGLVELRSPQRSDRVQRRERVPVEGGLELLIVDRRQRRAGHNGDRPGSRPGNSRTPRAEPPARGTTGATGGSARAYDDRF
jgi:hypothetical protein